MSQLKVIIKFKRINKVKSINKVIKVNNNNQKPVSSPHRAFIQYYYHEVQKTAQNW